MWVDDIELGTNLTEFIISLALQELCFHGMRFGEAEARDCLLQLSPEAYQPIWSNRPFPFVLDEQEFPTWSYFSFRDEVIIREGFEIECYAADYEAFDNYVELVMQMTNSK